MPGKPQVSGIDVPALVYIAFVLAVAFLPLLVGRRGTPREDSEGDSDEGGGGGGGGGPPPQRPGDRPRGGIPLDDAEPSPIRLRGHERVRDLVRTRTRRPGREPDRRPARTVQHP